MSTSQTNSLQPQQLDAQLVNPIITATTDVLGTMANTQVSLKRVWGDDECLPVGDISAVIALIGDEGEGTISLSFPMLLANLIVSRLLGTKPEQLKPDECADGIGELVNMISGNAKTILSHDNNSTYKLSFPTIVVGRGHEVVTKSKKGPSLIIEFESEGQLFHLQINFRSH